MRQKREQLVVTKVRRRADQQEAKRFGGETYDDDGHDGQGRSPEPGIDRRQDQICEHLVQPKGHTSQSLVRQNNKISRRLTPIPLLSSEFREADL